MPFAPPRACRCGAVVPAGQRCPRCTKAADNARGSASQRGYDAEWRRFRAEFLQRHPTCCIEGCSLLATDIDHIIGLHDGGLRFDPGNCRPMCHRCHSQRTARDQVPRGGKGGAKPLARGQGPAGDVARNLSAANVFPGLPR